MAIGPSQANSLFLLHAGRVAGHLGKGPILRQDANSFKDASGL